VDLPNLYELPFLPEECKETNLPQTSLPTQNQNPERSYAAAIEVAASPEPFSLMNLLSGASALQDQQNWIPHRAIQAQAASSTQANLIEALMLRHLEQQRFHEIARASSASHLTDYRLATGATQQAALLSFVHSNFPNALTSIEASIAREILRK
jgi:hypothetical protein